MSLKSKTQTWYDPSADVLYLVSKKGQVSKSEEVSPGITIEYDEQDHIVGVEILRASKVLAEKVVASLHAKQAGILGERRGKIASAKSKQKRVI